MVWRLRADPMGHDEAKRVRKILEANTPPRPVSSNGAGNRLKDSGKANRPV
jgi:hypothetical protein